MNAPGRFIRGIVKCASVLVLCLGGVAPMLAAESMQVNMLLVAPDGEEYLSHRNGALLGQVEGNIQGRFLGIDYQLEHVGFDDAGRAREDVSAVIVAGDVARILTLRELYAPLNVPVINISSGDMLLRESCYAGLYHTFPSDKMLRDAESQWRQANPGAQVNGQAWHPEFVKFAARDLNKRYSERFEVKMDDAAWAGWAATRMVAEAVVRTGSAEPEAIDRYLQESLAFDGQKGVGQTLRNNGQMRQPLLLVAADGELLGEAPVRGVAGSNELDSLGLPGCL